MVLDVFFFFFQAEDGIRDLTVTGVQTCALPISPVVHSARTVCSVCRHRWRAVRPPWCERCGQPEPLFGGCRLCADWPAALQRVRSAVWLAGGARGAVAGPKYGGPPRGAPDLAAPVSGTRPPGGAGALAPPAPPALRIPHSALVLVDGVFTAGATLAEAARALERAGAPAVLAVTFGRAVLPDFS